MRDAPNSDHALSPDWVVLPRADLPGDAAASDASGSAIEAMIRTPVTNATKRAVKLRARGLPSNIDPSRGRVGCARRAHTRGRHPQRPIVFTVGTDTHP